MIPVRGMRRWPIFSCAAGGTTVRLFPNTELTLERMSKNPTVNGPALQTQLNLSKGQIFCFIRIPVPESTFEVKTPRGTSLLQTVGVGRYDIRAEGVIVAGKSSFTHLKFTTEHGVVMIEPGQRFSVEDGYSTPAAPSDMEILMIQMDQLASLAEQLTSEELLKQN